MCIGSNWVNEAQDLIYVTKFCDLPNKQNPSVSCCVNVTLHKHKLNIHGEHRVRNMHGAEIPQRTPNAKNFLE